jgi:hypothetical protein
VPNEHKYNDDESRDRTLSRRDTEHICKKLEELRDDFRSMLSELTPIRMQRLKEVAGPHFERMASCLEELIQYLTHSDAKVRKAAIDTAITVWRSPISLSDRFESMAVSDASRSVRDSAVRALGNCYARTKDKRIGRLLASIVLDQGAFEEIRLTAYMSLMRLHGIMDFGDINPTGALVPLSLKEIDWSFVAVYCENSKGG